LFSGVMRGGLSTGLWPQRRGSVLSGPTFSKADDWADLVLSFNALNMNGYFGRDFGSVSETIRIGDRTGVGTTLSKITSGGTSLEVIGRLLVHTQIGTNQRYAHLIDSPLRAGVNAVGEMLKPRLQVVGS